MDTKSQAPVGIMLALITAMSWSSLPIAMKQVLVVMGPFTVVWYRFSMAAIVLRCILAAKRRLPPRVILSRPLWLILVLIATGGLMGNFVLFSSSLKFLSPTASQVIGQLSPVGMMLASVIILKEKMHVTPVIGAIMLILRLILFFNVSLIEIFTRLIDDTLGVIFCVGAAMVWMIYGVAQKVLLRQLASPQILFLLYTLCSIALLPLVSPAMLSQLSGWQFACLLFCGANTLVGMAPYRKRWRDGRHRRSAQ